MIVISRKKNESLVINNNITITVIEIRGDKVRLGVESPKEVPVHRQEVFDAIKRYSEQPQASAVTAEPQTGPAEPPPPHFPQRQPDKLDQFTAALQARLTVTVHRDLVAAALRDAGIEVQGTQLVPK
ncbi:MAG: carbon storage regulator CsrA [Pirellulaceae bacterium]|nr:carbon storage regulator CsrA [Pirellulaceae bacterium]